MDLIKSLNHAWISRYLQRKCGGTSAISPFEYWCSKSWQSGSHGPLGSPNLLVSPIGRRLLQRRVRYVHCSLFDKESQLRFRRKLAKTGELQLVQQMIPTPQIWVVRSHYVLKGSNFEEPEVISTIHTYFIYVSYFSILTDMPFFNRFFPF